MNNEKKLQEPNGNAGVEERIKKLEDRISTLETDFDNLEEDFYSVDINECSSLKELIGMQVTAVTTPRDKCERCPLNNYGTQCKKVELVGGSFLCLTPLPISITQ